MTLVMPLTDEDSEGDEEPREPHRHINILQKMLSLDRELILLAVLLTSYAAVRNMNQTISKNPLPKPFFPENPWVQDFYQGEIHKAFSVANQADVAFVMFYAPWDADCQRAKPIFEKVARYYHQQIYFMAVNCWEPSSVCKAHFNKIKQYPVFIAYFLRNRGVEYQGIIDFAHMTHFLSSVLSPLHRVHDLHTLITLRSTHDAVILAYIPFYGMFGGEHYYSFYKSSLKYLELDPRRDIAFAVMTDEKACHRVNFCMKDDQSNNPSMRLYMWNSTKVFDGTWDQQTIVKWIHNNVQRITTWIYPPGIKSNLLSQYINKGPTLILFTPRNMFLSHSSDYSMLQLAALDYFNCPNYEASDSFHWSLFSLSYFISSNDQLETVNGLKEMCSSTILSKFKQNQQFLKVPAMSNTTIYEPNLQCDDGGQGSRFCSQNQDEISLENAQSLILSKMLSFHYSKNGDLYSAESLLRHHLKNECRKFRFALKDNPDSWLHDDFNPPTQRRDVSTKGLACQSNSSLSFLVMDSLHFDHFASNLGININTKYGKKAAFIIDSKAESLYYLNSTFINMDLLGSFIYNFSRNDLKRFLRSSDTKPTGKDLKLFQVESVSSNSFHDKVINNNRTVLVFYYSPFCTYSQAIFHVYISVANALKSLYNYISFVRIDGENNDLEWPYTVDKYPSVMIFPWKNKASSRLFDSKTKLTIPNLSQFILYNLNFELRVQAQILFCLKQTFSDFSSINECMINLKLSLIYYLNHYNNQLRNTLIHFKLQTDEFKNTNNSKRRSTRTRNLKLDRDKHEETRSNFIINTNKIRCTLLYFQLINNYVNLINFSDFDVYNVSKTFVNFYHIYLVDFNSINKVDFVVCPKLLDFSKYKNNFIVENDLVKSIQESKIHSRNILNSVICHQKSKNSTKCESSKSIKNERSLNEDHFYFSAEQISADREREHASNSHDDSVEHEIKVSDENLNRNRNENNLKAQEIDVNNNEFSMSDEL